MSDEHLLVKLLKNRQRKERNETGDVEPENEFRSLCMEWGIGDKGDSYKTIPRFYTKPPEDDQVLKIKLREEIRALFLQRQSKAMPDNEELQFFWHTLEKNISPPVQNGEQMINYLDFKKASMDVSPKCRQFFRPSLFAKLLGTDKYGRISAVHFFNYVMRKVWLHQTRIGLSLCDTTGLGYLRENDLENYILELIPTLPELDKMDKSFYPFYVCTAVRKFSFFLDPLHTGKIKIQDILICGFLDHLLELRDEDMSKESQDANWFSAVSSIKVYGQYLHLDADRNGMLSKEELAKYGSGKLTPAFLDRVFQECLTYEGEMDYKTFLDFVLALTHKDQPQSIQYLFKILDTQHKGYLNVFDLHFFFKSILEQLRKNNQETVSFEDVKDEIFDMIKPVDPLKITCQDLIRCGQAETIIGLLIDTSSFWSYENRELSVPMMPTEIADL